MLDFLMISKRLTKYGMEIYPNFIVGRSSDLMIRGGDFYAIWMEDRNRWSMDEQDAIKLIDRELDAYVKNNELQGSKIQHMWDSEAGSIDRWHHYCQVQMRDSFHALDEQLIFQNTDTKKEDYASKSLPYALEPGDFSAWDRLVSVLYSEEERHKIEWAIGSIVSGDSRDIQKFMVLYGAAGTGKSTVLNVIQKLFKGYYSVFDARALGSSSNSFALEAFTSNPLVAIQHDGDLSRIEDNTRLNSLVSHELMTVNVKFKSTYPDRFKCFLFMGTNKPVKITDAKSGLIRRLIDVTPTGNKVSQKEYRVLMHNIDFELGAIASHCLDVYLDDPHSYDDYIPISMLGASNDFYNFISDSYLVFKKEDGTTFKAAWEMYKTYCEEARVGYPLPQRAFKEELKNYFDEYYPERYTMPDGTRVRKYFKGFRHKIFEEVEPKEIKLKSKDNTGWLKLECSKSLLDESCSECLAQYATSNGIPQKPWDDVETKLSDIDTTMLHYVKVPLHHIVIDFDIADKDGNKCYDLNYAEALKWPPTYAELSKSGQGIHLHYIYTGDPSMLSKIYDDKIEVKVFNGKSSLRRKLTKCNDIPLATISSGLPLKGDTKMVDFKSVESERGLRTLIKKNLNKEIHPATAPSIDFIKKILDDAYISGLHYDVSDLKGAILAFAAGSTHQSQKCIKMFNQMHFKSDEPSQNVESDLDKLVFYDCEVFPNLFIVNWKFAGEGVPVIRMINPAPSEIERILKLNLVGFNCRRYDNHMLYARLVGYTNEQLFNLSQKIINHGQNCFFSEAYNISYTDIYDFASAGNKKSLKKLEIEMGFHHQELGLPWDKPVPEELWEKVAEYCDNDVLATEAAFHYLNADWTAREILADLAGMSVNDTTNTLTTKIILGGDKNPQSSFNYRDLSAPVMSMDPETMEFLKEACPEMMAKPHGPVKSLLPYFDGYEFKNGKSMYRGLEVGEGGYAKGIPGIYTDVALLDVASMHPHSAIAEVLFGVTHTKAFREIVEGRVSIKHEAWEEVNHMLGGKLVPYISKVKNKEITAKQLANALKTAINSVYGLTSAGFDNAFRDRRNVDNIVAKRGALFMIDLLYAVRERGFIPAHIKTDSIKIPNATPEIIDFVMEFGKRYGYTFEHEATYEKMCLVNNAVYIAKFASAEHCANLYGYIPDDNRKNASQWTATGTQFQIPYVFKTLFSKEQITIEDMCEVKSVSSALYLDMNEDLPDVSIQEKELKSLEKKYKDVDVPDDIRHRMILLENEIAEGHNREFIGKVGQFCPVKSGCGGGILLRETLNKDKEHTGFASATGADGYRWLEAEYVRKNDMVLAIDRSYYNHLVDEAVDAISQYGDFEWFVSDDSYHSNAA